MNPTPMHGAHVVREQRPLRFLLLGFLLTLIAANALQFATRAANPLITSDGWGAVDNVVRQIPTGELDIGDLFIKRGTFDHSQPLRKLILLFHYRYFDLDFSVEAVIGVLFALVNLAILWQVVRSSRNEDQTPGMAVVLGFSALAAVYLSLNASVVFSWSLVTLAFTTHTFLLAFLVMAWLALHGDATRRLPWLFAVSLLMDMVADDTGIIATLAAILAVALHAARTGAYRRCALMAATITAACIVYKLGYAWLVPTLPTAHGARLGATAALGHLLAQASQAWQWLSIPLSASVAHKIHLRAWAAADAGVLQAAITCVLLAAHAWFWWRAVRGRANLAAFVAVGLMLLFYGLVAGMLLARVSVSGVGYLWQPRYTIIYAWNIVALLLMALAQLPGTHARAASPGPATARLGAAGLIAAAVVLLLLQLPLSASSWKGLRGLSAYQQRMAFEIGALAAQPAAPHDCLPQMVVCQFAPARRVRVMQFLQRNRLNLFSPAFQARNRLYPSVDAIPD